MQENKINSLSLIAEGTHFLACTTSGFKVIDRQTGDQKITCDKFTGGLFICAPLGRTSIFFCVGTGQDKDYER